MAKYVIPLSDTEALEKLSENKDVTSWNVLLLEGYVEVEVKKAVKGLEKYKA